MTDANFNMPLWLALEDEWWGEFKFPSVDSHAAWVNEILDEIEEQEAEDAQDDEYWLTMADDHSGLYDEPF